MATSSTAKWILNADLCLIKNKQTKNKQTNKQKNRQNSTQSVIKYNARKPQTWPVPLVKAAPQWGKSKEHNQILISSESGQDTSTWKISDHSPMHSLRNARKSQNGAKRRKSTDCDSNLNYEGGQDTSAYKISGHLLHAFSPKCPETQNVTLNMI